MYQIMHHVVLLEGAKSELYFHDSAHLLSTKTASEIIRSSLIIVIFVNFLYFTLFLNILISTTSYGLYVQNNFQLRTVFGQNLSPPVDL